MKAAAPSARPAVPAPARDLLLILGDQLDPRAAPLECFDPECDAICMVEVAHESTKVWSSKPRIALFLAAMRHFRDAQVARGCRVLYRELDASGARWTDSRDPRARVPAGGDETFGAQIEACIRHLRPRRLLCTEPGEWSVREEIRAAAGRAGVPLEFVADRHFLCSRERFAEHAEGRKALRMEFFYREMRRETGILMEGEQPAGGRWNFDADNREPFPKSGPGSVPAPRSFPPDRLTAEVLDLVRRRFAGHPGSLDHFDWPVTPADARLALDDFIARRLPSFGRWQDAMWSGEPVLFHSRLSAAMNLKLLDPRDALAAAEAAGRAGRAPLAAAEGFIRQILGWREYVRGVYWRLMPGYIERNALGASRPLPGFYWTGDTEMRCLREAIGQTLERGYAHHIQRLMVTGLYSLLLGVHPRAVHEWYLAVYADAVEWVELPNTLGMSQFADGGVMASKPYAASGKYIGRMSNHCAGCRFDPSARTGARACPFTTLYWDFVLRNEALLLANSRTAMQARNAARLAPAERRSIRAAAERVADAHA